MEMVTLVNRSSKTLSGTWDGRHYDLQPAIDPSSRIEVKPGVNTSFDDNGTV